VSKFIDEEFGVGFEDEYELNALEECNNDCWKEFSVDGNVSNYEVSKINDMINDKEYVQYSTRIILNYLCMQGKLATGEYFVDVSW
jgi:hypothetical protein